MFKIIRASIAFMAVIIFAISFADIVFAENSISDKTVKSSEEEYGQIKEGYKYQRGPPAHASAHGYRAKYHYHYYPSCKVYYDTARKIFFYLKGGNWEVGVSLPSHLKSDIGEYVSLELETDRPYLLNEERSKKYSSTQLNTENRQKNVFTKLWILLFAR